MNEASQFKRLNALVKNILSARERAGHLESAGRVNISWPVYDEKEVMGALEALLELRISQGPRVKQFEENFARYIGKKYAVAVNSGSSANLLALGALLQAGKLRKGDEVIIPATTFATVASPVLQLGLVPVYVDVEGNSWNLDPREVEKAVSKRTKAILAVHTFGNPADIVALKRIAKQHKLLLIEDCCEAHGARLGKRKLGSFGDVSTLSFFVAHNITTGEGGMVFTDDRALYDILRSMREFGRFTKNIGRFDYRDPMLGKYDTRYIFTRLGYNVRMTDIAAALGLAQLKKLDALNAKRIRIVNAYRKGLAPYTKYLRLPWIRRDGFHSFYGFPFVVEKDAPFTRMELVRFLEARGIETRPFFGGSLPDQPAFRTQPKRVVGKLPVARYLRDNAIFIGCHPELGPAQVAHVVTSFRDFFKTKDL